MTKDYNEFLKDKIAIPELSGFDVDETWLNPHLYYFQKQIVIWALKLGKAAIFAEVGLGKTIMQLSYAECIVRYTGKSVLILAPLAVSAQTIREGTKFGIDVKRVANQDEADMRVEEGHMIHITNYENLTVTTGANKGDDRFDIDKYAGIVLDESSRIKNYTSKTKKRIELAFQDTPYKLACSATPAPNDHMELGNHAQFLDILASNEMLSRWFINDTMKSGGYRLKKLAQDDFWRWLTSWAVCITKPSDLGDEYDMPEFELPKLNIIGHYVAASQETITEAQKNGRLFPDTTVSSTQLGKVKRKSLEARLIECKKIVDSIDKHESILIWCTLNDEADALKKLFKDENMVEVRGSDSDAKKEEKLIGFSDKKYRMLITKTKIAGHGMNWQHCKQAIFFGLDFSFESFYQAKGRNHRYGQEHEVNCHVIYSELEGNVTKTLERKQKDFAMMQSEMALSMKEHGLFREGKRMELIESQNDIAQGKDWTLYLGDCIERTKEIESDRVALSLFSPPFSNLYIYSDAEADMGNSSDDMEFFQHFAYLVPELLRITRPGGLVAMHVKDLPAYKNRDGYAGLRDFPGECIRMMELMNLNHVQAPDLAGLSPTEIYVKMQDWQRAVESKKKDTEGFRYHSRFNIWKDPVIEMQRTKNHGLLHKNFKREANACRQGMADYMLVFRKWPLGDDYVQVKHDLDIGDFIGDNPPLEKDYMNTFGNRTAKDNYSIMTWQQYASPSWPMQVPEVWMDIDQTRVLNYHMAKDNSEEKHICPLQLDVIERAIHLWTNEGDTVFTPFAGIGSEVVSAIKMKRKGIGIELKENYWEWAIKHCQETELEVNRPNFFDLVDVDEIAGD